MTGHSLWVIWRDVHTPNGFSDRVILRPEPEETTNRVALFELLLPGE